MNLGLFTKPGATVIVDGQYGSTGKGVVAAWLARQDIMQRITHVTCNAGPNSGHTSFLDRTAEKPLVLKQLPTVGAHLHLLRDPPRRPGILMNAGAVIDVECLAEEVRSWADYRRVYVHPTAALITEKHRMQDAVTTAKIASTGKGTGPAMMDKMSRQFGLAPTAQQVYMPMLPDDIFERAWDNFWNWNRDIVVVEVSQGFSLGLNSTFYPWVTSRECTVMQGIADARIPAQMVDKVIGSYRTFPIRVGNSPEGGYSGDCYADQSETSWEALGVSPELTTVTKRVRRVFTWSRNQFMDSVNVNRPDIIFLNFMNYLEPDKRPIFIAQLRQDYRRVMGRQPDAVLLGFSPHWEDITVV